MGNNNRQVVMDSVEEYKVTIYFFMFADVLQKENRSIRVRDR